MVFGKQRRPEIHLFGARFKEQHGDIKGARVAYEVLRNDVAVGLLEAIMKHANFEQRQVSNVIIVHFLTSIPHLRLKTKQILKGYILIVGYENKFALGLLEGHFLRNIRY